MFKSVAIICGLIFLSACTQEPARITYKGEQFYGKNNTEASQLSYVPIESNGFQESAGSSDVGMNDLQPVSSRPLSSNSFSSNAVSSKPLDAPVSSTPSSMQLNALPQTNTPAAKPFSENNSSPRFIWPVADGKIISKFSSKNDGISISAGEGEPIWAAANGTVAFASDAMKEYGNMIIVKHEGGYMTAYSHAQSISVKKGDHVKQGDIIGYVGSTGAVKTAQLHFGVRNGDKAVNPEQYLPSNFAGL